MTKAQHQFIPYSRQNIDRDDIKAVLQALRGEYITQGPLINKFEDKICDSVNSKYSIVVNSATSALHLACLALQLKKNDLLWTSPISFVSSANCGRYCNAEVDFVDIDSSTGLMDTLALSKKLKEAERIGRLPKVLIPVHLCGTSCDMKEISKICSDYQVSIIEDASHALGGRYLKNNIGCCEYSDLSVFSFHPVKIITTGEGGAVTTNNFTLFEKIKELRTHGITKDPNKFIRDEKAPWIYEQQDLGYNYRLTDIQCALGISQISKLEKIVKKRNDLFERYKELLNPLPLELLEIPKGCYSSLHLAVIRLNNKNKEFHLNVFMSLKSKGIGVQVHYHPIHLQPYYRDLGFKKGDFPEAEFYSNNAISIPLYPGLTYEQQVYIVKKIEDSINENS